MRFTAFLRVGLFLSMLACAPIASTLSAQQPTRGTAAVWLCFRGDSRNTGQAPWRAAGPAHAWKFETLPSANGSNNSIFASPILSSEGTIYVGAGSHLYALDAAEGNKKWQFGVPNGLFYASPALDNKGTLYMGCEDGFMYALDAHTRDIRWSFKTDRHIHSSPALDAEGQLYFGSGDQNLYALEASSGKQRWKVAMQHDIESSPVIGNKGVVYCQNWGKLAAVNTITGQPVWTFQAPEDVFSNSTPALDTAGTLYAVFVLKGTTKNAAALVVALDAQTGTKKWAVPLPAYVFASPAVGTNGLVYIGCGDGRLYALEPKTGKIRWQFVTDKPIQASPAIGKDGTVYVGSYDKKLYALDGSSGMKKWEFETGGGIQGSPVVSLDNTVFVASLDGNVYAVSANAKPSLK